MVSDSADLDQTGITISTAEQTEPTTFNNQEMYGGYPTAIAGYKPGVEPGNWDFTVDTNNLDELSSIFDDFIIIATYKAEIA